MSKWFRVRLTSSSVIARKSAICESEKPKLLALRRTSAFNSPGCEIRRARSLIICICCRYQGSILVASCTWSIEQPAHIANCTCCSRYSVGVRILSSSSSLLMTLLSTGKVKIASLRSNERSAFISASGKLRPIAIASPTLFIVVVSLGSASANFSKANRGAFTTT